MLRRAFLISSLLGAVSAVAALAFAPELTRVGRAALRARGFTPVPEASVNGIHRAASTLLSPESDSAQGKYCRFPPKGAPKVAPPIDSLSSVGADSESTASLSLEGQSRNPLSQSEAICTGVTPPRAP